MYKHLRKTWIWRCENTRQVEATATFYLYVLNDLMFSPTKENLVTKLAICGKVLRRARACIWHSSTVFEAQVDSGNLQKVENDFFHIYWIQKNWIYTVAGFTFLEETREGSEWQLVFQELEQYSKTERKWLHCFKTLAWQWDSKWKGRRWAYHCHTEK